MSELKPLMLDASAADFSARLDKLLAWQPEFEGDVVAVVADIIAAVRSDGDRALLEYTRRFDRRDSLTVEQLEISGEAMQQALTSLPAEQREALQRAAERILSYHQHQKQESWQYREADGTVLGQKITPLQRVGIYVPGGKASYPSSVLMNALPAKVAGVDEIIMVVPAPGGELNPAVLAAATIAGVDRVFTVGGAQAVAALAYGTESIPKVDKVVGPGNIYVATAKKAVFGEVGVDMIAGPSEILVICDGATSPDWIAMDLFSQAEHDEQAQSILISPDAGFLQDVLASMDRLLAEMPRRDIIKASINGRGALIKVADLDEAIGISNRIAPEHLELSVAEPEAMLVDIRHAGAVFSAVTHRRPWVITALAPITSCRPRPRRAFHRHWVFMISKSAPR